MSVDLVCEWGIPQDLATATRQAEATKLIGGTYAKWQHLTPDLIVSRDAVRYWDPALGGPEAQRDVFTGGGLTPNEWAVLAGECHAQGVKMLVTPFDLDAVDVLVMAGVDAFKVASGDVTFRPLLEKVALKGLPVFLSTGAATMEEVGNARDTLEELEVGVAVTLLACDLVYPCPPESAGFVPSLHRLGMCFHARLGFSDHTRELVTGAVAVAHGATVLEKHVTLNPYGGQPDDKMALSVDEAKAYLRLAREAAVLCAPVEGDPEAPARVGARRTAYATRDLPVGHVIGDGDVAWLRPCPEGSIPASENLDGVELTAEVKMGERITVDSLTRLVVL